MEFKVSSSLLLRHLKGINGAIVNNPVIPILENFLFEIYDGILHATASDLQTTMRTEIAVDASKNISVAIPANLLINTLSNLPEQPITVHVDSETFAIEIIADKGRYKLAGENAIDFPKIPSVTTSTSIELSASVLSRAIASTLFAVATDEMRPATTGVLFEITDTSLTCVGTDGHRLVRFRRTDVASSNEHTIIVPRKALTLLKNNLPDDESTVILDANSSNVFINWHNNQVICRLIDERFPDYEAAIPVSNPNHMIIDRLELLSSLRRINFFANKSTHQVRLKVEAENLQISAEDLDFGNDATENLPCEYEGEPMEIGFNAKLMMDMLSNMENNRITVELMAPNRPAILLPMAQQDNEDLLMLVMPVMLSQYV